MDWQTRDYPRTGVDLLLCRLRTKGPAEFQNLSARVEVHQKLSESSAAWGCGDGFHLELSQSYILHSYMQTRSHDVACRSM